MTVKQKPRESEILNPRYEGATLGVVATVLM